MASVESEIIKTANVQVAVRCRPANMEEKKTGQASVVATETAEKKVTVQYGPAGKKASKTFNFDKVFGTYSTQEEVFDQMVRPIVSECLEGFNCTIFAYGQTGTGKTHTMEGDIHSEEHAGIVSVDDCIWEGRSGGFYKDLFITFLSVSCIAKRLTYPIPIKRYNSMLLYCIPNIGPSLSKGNSRNP